MTRREQIEQMLGDDPNDSFLRYALAMELVGAGDDALAAAEFQRLLAQTPDYVPAYYQCGQVMVRLGRNAEARTVLQAGLGQAQRANDGHAAEEIQGLLASVME